MDQTDYTTWHSFESAGRNDNFYVGLIWSFGHSSFSKDPPIETGWTFFLAFCVHFREGDIYDLEQKCPAVDRFSHPLSSSIITDRTLLVETFPTDQ